MSHCWRIIYEWNDIPLWREQGFSDIVTRLEDRGGLKTPSDFEAESRNLKLLSPLFIGVPKYRKIRQVLEQCKRGICMLITKNIYKTKHG